jgi:surface carbohydrate biosynthesis protein
MPKTKKKVPLRIVLLLDNKNRELAFLELVKEQLEHLLGAKVSIVGSIAEYQYVRYQLSVIKPHLVFISQIFEQSCRQLAEYARKSGSLVAILPNEVRSSMAYEKLVSSGLSLNSLADYAFMPGRELLDVFSQSDLPARKLYITGTPKIDLALRDKGLLRNEFAAKYNLDASKKNLFIFTSFVQTNLEYLKNDVLFSKQLVFKQSFNRCVDVTRKAYYHLVIDLVTQFAEYNIIIKPHPLEPSNQLIKVPGSHTITQATISDCFDSIDLAIHWTSTVALECWLHDIPVLEYFPTPKQSRFLPNFTDGNPLYFEQAQLINGIRKYTTKPLEKKYIEYQEKYLRHAFFQLDGKSTQRIATILQKTIHTQPKVNYQLSLNLSLRLLLAVENLIGHTATRTLLKVLNPNFQAKYAIENYLVTK